MTTTKDKNSVNKPGRKPFSTTTLVWAVAGVLTSFAYLNWSSLSPFTPKGPLSFSEKMTASPKLWTAGAQPFDKFLVAKNTGQLAQVGVTSHAPGVQGEVLYTLKNGEQHSTALSAPLDSKELEVIAGKGAEVAVLQRSPVLDWTALILPLTVFLTLLFLVLRRRPGASAGLGSFSTMMAGAPDLVKHEDLTARFSDVVGAEQAKKALLQVKAFLTDPTAYTDIGAKPYRGVLLGGPPGTGKTMLAKALAGECGANFISVDGSSFSASLMGVGISKVEALFKTARLNAPCIIFIDEFDGLGKRSESTSAAGSEDNRIINKLLVELDGFTSAEGVIVLAATNHPERLDEALLRDGRFDSSVQVSLPTQAERLSLFEMYLAKVKATLGTGTTASLARLSAGMSPAAIAGVVNKAAVLAADARSKFVAEEHILRALEDKQLGGEANAVNRLTGKTRERVAVHEAGHAIVGHKMGKGIVERVSIEPRGSALGVTYITQEDEDNLFEPKELTQRLAMLLAGRQAELVALGNTSTGASDDLKRATELATSMVGRMGFSEKFGLVSISGLPPELISQDMRNSLLTEVAKLLADAQKLADDCLVENKTILTAMTASLLEHETIGPDQLKNLFCEQIA